MFGNLRGMTAEVKVASVGVLYFHVIMPTDSRAFTQSYVENNYSGKEVSGKSKRRWKRFKCNLQIFSSVFKRS